MSSKIPVAISFSGVANFLGVVGVIGSLIFVGLELRQTQRIAQAGQQQERTSNFLQFARLNQSIWSGLAIRGDGNQFQLWRQVQQRGYSAEKYFPCAFIYV